MFVFYSSDNCIEYRPWLAYLTFPAIVVASFVLAVEGPIPEPRSMLVLNFVPISGLVVLVYMIFWMNHNSRGLKSELQEQIDSAITQKQLYSLVGLAFFSVFREGLETVLFLAGVRFTTESTQDTIIGGVLGLLIAALLGYLLIRGSIQLNLQKLSQRIKVSVYLLDI